MKKAVLLFGAFVLLLWPTTGHATPDYYQLDKPHTQVLFSVNHLGFVESYGRFTDYRGGFVLDRAHPKRSWVDVTIMTSSIDMGDENWNDALKDRGYFDVDEYPTMTFRSTKFRMTGKDTAEVTGDLTLLGVTNPVTFNMRLNKIARHPFMERYVVGLSGEGKLRRSDFGMTAGLPLIGNQVTIHLEVEGDRVADKGDGFYNQGVLRI
jgi:polyisoprenoid-binding protein YceI